MLSIFLEFKDRKITASVAYKSFGWNVIVLSGLSVYVGCDMSASESAYRLVLGWCGAFIIDHNYSVIKKSDLKTIQTRKQDAVKAITIAVFRQR